MNNISDDDGALLVRSARAAVTDYLKTGRRLAPQGEIKSRFAHNSGIFVTINKEDELRGCIGFPTPDRALYMSLIDAAIAAATEDPRFPHVEYSELPRVTFEVTVLSPPEVIRVASPSEYPSKIKVGRDGLIVRWEHGSGLLLPQVPLEYGWGEEEFLAHTCQKAGAPMDAWKQKSTTVLKFGGTVFKESSPSGPVVRAGL